MNHLFYGCESLTSLDLTTFNTNSVTNMNSMFSGCSSLKSLDLFHLNIKFVKDMSNMFSGCASLQKIDFSNHETSSLTNLQKMFYECKNLESINLSSFNTISVISMNEMFAKCTSLKYLDIYNIDMKNCNNYTDMFSNVTNLRFINMYKSSYAELILRLVNKQNNLTVCLKEKPFDDNNINFCCDYDFNKDKCIMIIPPTIQGGIFTEYIKPSENALINSDMKNIDSSNSIKPTNIYADNKNLNYTSEIGGTESMISLNDSKIYITEPISTKITTKSTNIEQSDYRVDTRELITSKIESNKSANFNIDTKEITTSKIDTKVDTNESYKTDKITYNDYSEEVTSSKIDTIKPKILKLRQMN